jgi:hypothetical protein
MPATAARPPTVARRREDGRDGATRKKHAAPMTSSEEGTRERQTTMTSSDGAWCRRGGNRLRSRTLPNRRDTHAGNTSSATRGRNRKERAVPVWVLLVTFGGMRESPMRGTATKGERNRQQFTTGKSALAGPNDMEFSGATRATRLSGSQLVGVRGMEDRSGRVASAATTGWAPAR